MKLDHFYDVFAFLGFFAFCYFLASITKPKNYRKISVGECLKPNKRRKNGTWKAGEIMSGGVMANGDKYDEAGILVRPEVRIER